MSESLDFNNYQAIAFDFDGTVADTVPIHTQARLEAFSRMADLTGDARYATISPEIHAEAHRHGSNPHAIIGWALQAAGIVHNDHDEKIDQTVDLKKEVYLELCGEGIPQMPFSVEFIHAIGRLGIPQTIVTTAYKQEVTPFINKYGLNELINADTIVTMEDVGREFLKPHPRAYEIAIERLGLQATPEKMLVFEDTPGGLMSAIAAKTTTLAMCTTHIPEDFNGVPYDFIFDGFKDLPV